MSDQVNPAPAENTNQAEVDSSKPAGQDPAPVVETVNPDPAPVTEAEPPKEEVKVEPVVYDLKKPDGSPLDPAVAEKIVSFAKEQGLSSAQAQKIYDREVAAEAARVAEEANQYNERKSQWVDTVKNDKEYGGDNFKKTASDVHAVIKKFARPEFVKTLDETGLGNHPELVYFVANIAKSMAPDQFVQGGSQPSEKRSAIDVLYDKTVK